MAVAKGLKYCNYCGAQLPSTDKTLESREVWPHFLVSVMAGVFVLGLPAIAFLVFMLNAALKLGPGSVLPFAWVLILLLVVLEAVFLMLLLRRKPRNEELSHREQSKRPQTKELEEKYAGALAEPMSSVTEHTTRAFDSVPRERI
jgi:hypothetical protein